MATTEFTAWHKSTRSQVAGDCVEVSPSGDRQLVGVRDTTDRAGSMLTFDGTDWQAFVTEAKAGSFVR